MELHMNPFKGRHFQRDIILWAVRWYCKYGISYRELQEMLAERGVNVDHSTIYRWVQRYAPEMEKRLRWYWRNPSDLCPWHMDETYVKVNGRWAYSGPSTAGAALSIFISPPVVTAKLHTGFWVKSSTT
jgi:IS6 family transposase